MTDITYKDAMAVPHKYRNRFLRDTGGSISINGGGSGGSSVDLSPYLTKLEANSLYLMQTVFDELFEKKTLEDGTVYIRAKYTLASDGDLVAFGMGTSQQSSGVSSFAQLSEVAAITNWQNGQTLVYQDGSWVAGTASSSTEGKIYTGSMYIEVNNTTNTISLKGVDVSKIKDYTVSSGTDTDGTTVYPALKQFGSVVMRFGTFAQKSGLSVSDIPDLSGTYASKDHTHSGYLGTNDTAVAATKVVDYGSTAGEFISIGYRGASLSSCDLLAAYGTVDGKTVIKDISPSNVTVGKATRLAGTASKSIWGNNYWVNGQPQDVDGSIEFNVTEHERQVCGFINNVRAYGLYINDNGIGMYDWKGKGGSGRSIFGYYNNTTSMYFAYDDDMKIGIGKNNPEYKLDVNGAVRIGNGIIKWDSANNALYVECPNGQSCGFYSTGGLACYSGLGNGTGSVSALANLTLSDTLKANTVNTALIESDSDMELYADELDIHADTNVNGCINSSSLQVGSNSSQIKDIKVSGGYLYLTVGTNKYRASLTSVSSY